MISLRMILFLGLAFASITAVILQGRATNLNPFVALVDRIRLDAAARSSLSIGKYPARKTVRLQVLNFGEVEMLVERNFSRCACLGTE